MEKEKPVIGILPTYNLTNEKNDPYQDRASFVTMYSNLILQCGGIPIGILEKDVSEYTSVCDGYLWSGGTKIWQEFYPILEDCIKNRKPFLGICLGAQAMSIFFNMLEEQKSNPDLALNEIYQENKEKNPYLKKLETPNMHLHIVTKDQESIELAKHKIKIVPNTFLEEIYKCQELQVVSLHSSIIARMNNPEILISATSEDGAIEAIEYHENDNHILGVLYHPEIGNDRKIFEWFLKCTNPKKRWENKNARITRSRNSKKYLKKTNIREKNKTSRGFI